MKEEKKSMKHRKFKELLFLLILIISSPIVVFADATDATDGHHSTESSVEIQYFSIGDAKSNIGNAQVSASSTVIQTEYEANDIVYSFNYERWNYNWTNPNTLPFISGTTNTPWSTFNTLQFGFSYEHEIDDQWELNYYIEAESSFEKETSESNEYEAGIDFIYEPSKEWVYTVNLNLEYLDATGSEFGVDVEIEWNHDKKDGWSGEFEISSEFPESSLTYHFTREFSTTLFSSEGGTSTIRLSDSSPVTNTQGGYFEDEYSNIGIKIDYEFEHESYLSFALQKNSDRSLSFLDSTGRVENSYEFSDTVEVSIGLSYTF